LVGSKGLEPLTPSV